MLKLADTMYKANGFDKGPNIIVTDTKDTQRGLDTGTIYINLEQLSSFSAGDLVNAIAHESSHSEVLGESEENFVIEKGSRAKDKFDSPKDTEKVDLDGYLDTLEGEYTKEKIRLAEVKEKLPEEKGEKLLGNFLTLSQTLEAPEKEILLTKNGVKNPVKAITFKELQEMNDKELLKNISENLLILAGNKVAIKGALEKLGLYFEEKELQKLLTYNNQNQKLLTYK